MATALTPPMGGKGVLTVDDDQVEKFLAAGWVKAEGAGSGTREPEPTDVITETGGPQADDSDIEFVATVVSDSLGDESVLVTDFGRQGDEPVKGSTEIIDPAARGDVDGGITSVGPEGKGEPADPEASTKATDTLSAPEVKDPATKPAPRKR